MKLVFVNGIFATPDTYRYKNGELELLYPLTVGHKVVLIDTRKETCTVWKVQWMEGHPDYYITSGGYQGKQVCLEWVMDTAG